MKTIISVSLAVALAVASLPVYAQSSGASGSAPVAGEGPGGSGAGQPSAGPSKTPPAAPDTDGAMMKAPSKMTKDPASGSGQGAPAGSSTTN